MGKQSESYITSRFKSILWSAGLSIAVLLILAPLFLLLKYAISDTSSINTGGNPVPFWPYHPTLRMFVYLFTDKQFYGVVMNSVIIACGTVVVSSTLR